MKLLAVEDQTLQANFDLITRATFDTGGRQVSVRWGSSSVTFTASSTSAQVTIAHGLGKAPAAVVAMAKTPANARVTLQESAAADATNIYITGFQSAGTVVTLSQAFYWLAIG